MLLFELIEAVLGVVVVDFAADGVGQLQRAESLFAGDLRRDDLSGGLRGDHGVDEVVDLVGERVGVRALDVLLADAEVLIKYNKT